MISHNQLINPKKNHKKPKGKTFKNKQLAILYSCIHKTENNKQLTSEKATKIGHGLGFTK
jgi:hypothetical protein